MPFFGGETASSVSSEDDNSSYMNHQSSADSSVHSQAFSITDEMLFQHNQNGNKVNKMNGAFTIRIDSKKSKSSSARRTFCVYTLLIVLCGAVASSAFLILGVTSADQDQFHRFEKQANELVANLVGNYQEYQTSALWIYESCHANQFDHDDQHSICSRIDFLELYQYLQAGGLFIMAAQFIPRVSHEKREEMEAESREFYSTFFSDLVDYQGFTGFKQDFQEDTYRPPYDLDDDRTSSDHPLSTLIPRTNQTEYFPIHYIAPVYGNEYMIDLDVLSTNVRREALEIATASRKPTLSSRLAVYDETYTPIPGSYTLMLLHPGITIQDPYRYATSHDVNTLEANSNDHSQHDTPKEDMYYDEPNSIASIQISVLDVLRDITQDVSESIHIYLYQRNRQQQGTRPLDEEYTYLGGGIIGVHSHKDDVDFDEIVLEEGEDKAFRAIRQVDLSINHARDSRRVYEENLSLGNRDWTVVIVAGEGAYEAQFLYFILGASFIMIACMCIALWFYSSMHRARTLSTLRAHSRAEKAAMIIQTSRDAAKAERELNDFLSHEIRNPLSSAIAATSFVSAEVNQPQPLATKDAQQSVREDMNVINSSLQFINDLLRNILDMHRASSQQMTIDLSPTDIRADVLEPVATMLYKRHDSTSNGAMYEVQLECPHEHLIIMTDRLRLKQIVMNLASNSRKFIDKGFIRLRADIDERGMVVVSVEDSGTGIPENKKASLFSKFQESLDSLSQGTGIGLALCKHLSYLMGGELALDNDYDSGIEGYPGAKFDIILNTKPLSEDDMDHHHSEHTRGNLDKSQHSSKGATEPADSSDSSGPSNTESPQVLPKHLKVLFVDDDFVLRKMFMRSIKRAVPEWDVSQASNGETALRLTDTEEYDIIFLDQYMASVEKQLLGTETAIALRAKGVRSKICGLSANDMEEAFLKSGATSFMMKPFPCQKEPLMEELLRVLYRPDINVDVAVNGVSLVMEDIDDDDDDVQSANDDAVPQEPQATV